MGLLFRQLVRKSRIVGAAQQQKSKIGLYRAVSKHATAPHNPQAQFSCNDGSLSITSA